MVRQSTVSLVIFDHMLQGNAGADLAKQIKKIKPHVPILIYSGITPETLGEGDCFMSHPQGEVRPSSESSTKSASIRIEPAVTWWRCC